MKPERHGRRRASLFGVLALWLCAQLAAGAPSQRPYQLEAGLSKHNLDAGNPDWLGMFLRGTAFASPGNVWTAELVYEREWDDTGSFFGIGQTHDFNADWYGYWSIGAGSQAFFFPKFRADGLINKKWLPARNLITTLGLGYYDAPDEHQDESLLLGAVYYFTGAPLVAEAGIRWNQSDPGAVNAQSQYIVLTVGRNQQHYLTLRYQDGTEAYLPTSAGTAVVEFPSSELSLSWRQWLARDHGFAITGVHYENPYYKRSGFLLSVFHAF